MVKKVAIFASGSGSNAENLIRYFQVNESIKIELILCNRSDAYVLKRAEKLGVPATIIPTAEWNPGEKALSILQNHHVEFIILAGFLLRIPDLLLHTYPDKIINIHPALLPKYGGKGMYGDRVHEAVVANREKESGITIHYINEHYDEGQIIRQFTCPVLPEDTAADVAAKVHALEYEHYPRVIKDLLI